jgi:hypothetical protein
MHGVGDEPVQPEHFFVLNSTVEDEFASINHWLALDVPDVIAAVLHQDETLITAEGMVILVAICGERSGQAGIAAHSAVCNKQGVDVAAPRPIPELEKQLYSRTIANGSAEPEVTPPICIGGKDAGNDPRVLEEIVALGR